jgi:hypothetical protein
MNEQIQQLAKQAEIDYDLRPEIARAPVWIGTDEELEKFARLIVAECVAVVKPTQHHEIWAQSYLGGVDGLELLDSKVKEIKKHFGVGHE